MEVRRPENEDSQQNMPANPAFTEKRLNDAVNAWRSLKPQRKFIGLTVDEFEAELKPAFDARAEIADLEAKLTGARNRRAEVDAQALLLVTRLANAIKSDADEGEDSELLEAMGYVPKSKRQSGLHRGTPATTEESLPKAA